MMVWFKKLQAGEDDKEKRGISRDAFRHPLSLVERESHEENKQARKWKLSGPARLSSPFYFVLS